MIEEETCNPIDLGNVLSMYYYKLVYSIVKNEDFVFDINNTCNDFFNQLPKFIPSSKYEYLRDKLLELNFSEDLLNNFILAGYAMWAINSEIKNKTLIIMKPVIQELFDNAFEAIGKVKVINNPVIHFRCADTPFVRNNEYSFQHYCFFKNAILDAKNKLNREFDSITILYYNKHRSSSDEINACNIYVNSLKEYLENNGYKITIQSENQVDDFATIYYAPISISTSSSYSFMAGYFGKGIFISPENGNKKCSECGEWMYKGYNLLNDDVPDYMDTSNVIEQLKKCPK